MSEHLYDFQHPLTGGTVRSCLDCGLPVYGGPTRCVPCVMGYPDDANASVEHFVTDVTRTLRERNQNLHGVMDRIEKAVGVPTQAATYTADAVEDTIARLTRERDAAVAEINRLMTEATPAENARLTASLAYEMDRNVARSADAHAATLERDAWRRRAEAAEREAEEAATAYNAVAADLRVTAAERDAALRWSRLWHAEARRLWREVAALTDQLDDERLERAEYK